MRLYQVDAFTDVPFKGNPACVCMLEADRPDGWKQDLAREMNLSETAFVLRQEDGFSLRWFTPKTEVSLCGHATLATAHILWEEGTLAANREARFATKSGLLSATKSGDWIAMDFPARFVEGTHEHPELNKALGIRPVETNRRSTENGSTYLVEVASAQEVRDMAPDFPALASLEVRSAIVTARAEGARYDFVSRFFAPGAGINEDPVTGSAHCYLAPYWGTKFGRNTLTGYQASERGGIVGCEWRGDRVILRGKAVTIFRGELVV